MSGAPGDAPLALAQTLEHAYGLALRLHESAADNPLAAELLELLDDARARSVGVLSGAVAAATPTSATRSRR